MTRGCFALSVVVLLVVRLAQADATDEPCRPIASAHVLVRAREHRLYACGGGTSEQTYDVRLAHDGVGKKAEGDGKLPLGTYALGSPRASKPYGVFVPIGYPTAEQRRLGYSGGSVGIHGPDRRVRWLGRFVNSFDTTDGCVGIATDEQMAALARWIRRKRPAVIVIEDA